jgi:hypothetical protein
MIGGWRIPWLLTATSLTFAASALVAPASAVASCGDYVLLGSHGEKLAGHTPLPPLQAERPAQPDHQPPAPCQGPHCSHHPAAPPAPPVLAPVSAEEWGHLPFLPNPPLPGPARSCREQTHAQPIHRGTSVYHPPRPDLVPSPV